MLIFIQSSLFLVPISFLTLSFLALNSSIISISFLREHISKMRNLYSLPAFNLCVSESYMAIDILALCVNRALASYRACGWTKALCHHFDSLIHIIRPVLDYTL